MIANRPIAIGSETVSILIVSSVSVNPPNILPKRSPMAMAMSIQTGR